MQEFSHFADNIRRKKYAHKTPNGLETWEQTAHRVASNVFRAVNPPKVYEEAVCEMISSREFMPGGRYLASSGREFHQTQNCLLLKAQDSREGWSELAYKCFQALMTGAGIGVVYSHVRPRGKLIRRTGGTATGPIALMQIINDGGRQIRQGGERRSAIWAGLHWWHEDIFDFIATKNWPEEVRKLKAKNFSFPATLDGTNISVILDRAFFDAFDDESNPRHGLARQVYWQTVKQMCSTAEPGFSIDYDDPEECLRNAPVAAETHVLTKEGYVKVGDVVDRTIVVWTGHRWAETIFKKTGHVSTVKVTMTGDRVIVCDPSHEFIEADESRINADQLYPGIDLKMSAPPNTWLETGMDAEAYTLGFIFGAGSFTRSGHAEVTLCTPEKKACRARFDDGMVKSENLSDARGYYRIQFEGDVLSTWSKERITWSKERIPSMVIEWPLDRKASFIAGLFDSDGSYQPGRVRVSSIHASFLHDVRRLLEEFGVFAGVNKAGLSGYSKSQGYNLTVMSSHVSAFARLIPTYRLSVEPFKAYREGKIKVVSVEPWSEQDVFCCDVGVHEHSFMAEGVIISNCTEVTSRDTDDICNLGSINMAKVDSLEQMRNLVHYGCAFLLAGTVYSHVPYPQVDMVRSKNRRLGLGLMGLHEWLIKRGKPYGPDGELEEYLKEYAKATEVAADVASMMELSAPIKTRAIAPTGTIGIVAETTTGIEPLFCVAYKRRYLKTQDVFSYEYVVDPTAKRLIEGGVDPSSIEDAYSISPERRIAFQAWVQQYVDHGISSTINTPRWGSEQINEDNYRDFGEMLYEYLPRLRGVTCYPDGAREGQPITACSYAEAMDGMGVVHEEQGDVCSLRGGSCGA